jgi:hypothetical protein
MIVLFVLVALFLILHLNLPSQGGAKRSSTAYAEIQYAYTGRLPTRLKRCAPPPLPPFLVRVDELRTAA